MNSNTNEKGVLINGRAKAFALLQCLGEREKSSLLKKISLKNARLAEDLAENSYNFSQIYKLSDNDLKLVFANVQAGIFGVAIRNLNLDFQKRVLTLAHRTFAEKAYETFSMELPDEQINIKRAQAKINEVVISLIKNKQIIL